MRVFLACPITFHVDPITHQFDKTLKRVVSALKCELETRGHRVFLAVEEEEWGLHVATPEESVDRDHQELIESDVLISIPGNPPSGGCHVELGWASASGKPILLLLAKHGRYSPLVLGLHRMTNVSTLYFPEYPGSPEWPPCVKNIHEFLDSFSSPSAHPSAS